MFLLLIIIGVSLILLNLNAIKKEDNSFSSILKREESTANRDYDVEIISIRRDLAESILDIQKEMEEMKKSIKNIGNSDKLAENYSENIKVDDIIINDKVNNIENQNVAVISEIDFTSSKKKINKVDEVKSLVENGFSDEEICEKMSIGKGEVLLIKGLFKN